MKPSELAERVQRNKDVKNKRYRERYAYARSLGFNGEEAQQLCKQSRSNILKTAKEAGKVR